MPTDCQPKFPNVEVSLTQCDGNVFSIIAAVNRGLRNAGHADAGRAFSAAAMNCASYDDVLRLATETVAVS